MQFTKAVRKKAKLRLAITGPSGSGKTWGALKVAKGLGGKIAVIDTERGSASLYCDICEFDTLELEPPYSPERYVEAVRAAEEAGYDTIIIDSATHEWSGTGGCLEINERTAKARFQGNTWAAWNETTPRHKAFIDAMLHSKCHVIATGRSKTETAQTEGPNGKKKVVKLGMKTEQRDGFEYEFTVVLDLIHEGHFATASKDRTCLFSGDPQPLSEATGHALREWLESGVVPDLPWYADLIASVNGCTTRDALAQAWEEAKHRCRERGDMTAYQSIKTAMEAAAARLTSQGEAA
jgi:hypothetical protein